MPFSMIERNGPPDAQLCPAIVCDGCGSPINRDDAALVLWKPGREPDGRPSPSEFRFVHQGRCDRLVEQQHGHHYSQELSQFMDQLVHNYATPFRVEPEVEYIAPSPSMWRLRPDEDNQVGPVHDYGDG